MAEVLGSIPSVTTNTNKKLTLLEKDMIMIG
jgi:hypothetical protein